METDAQRLRRDAVTYYRRSRDSAAEDTRERNRIKYNDIKADLETLGFVVRERNGTIETFDPRKN